jgi:MinD superfamily P-loop ATPase
VKRIAILSGKGGVGKSSIAASIAIALKDKFKIVLVDTDADCPNQHILFEGKEKSMKVLQVSHTAKIDYEKCKRCGKCANVCKFDALDYREKPVISELFCEGCNACAVACPYGAIEMIPVANGEAKVIETEEGFPLVYGKLYPGKSGSGKIVHDVREIADGIAKNSDLAIIDSAAGIGCPVIASIMGCDYAIGVVEPTQSSISDLERAVETAEHFNIPYGVVVNKAGISAENEKRIRNMWGGKIMAELPYDTEVPKLLARKLPPIYAKSEISKKLKDLSKAVEDLFR